MIDCVFSSVRYSERCEPVHYALQRPEAQHAGHGTQPLVQTVLGAEVQCMATYTLAQKMKPFDIIKLSNTIGH